MVSKTLNVFKTNCVLSVLFLVCVNSETENIVRAPNRSTYLGAFVKFNDARRSLESPEFKEALKTYASLFSGKDFLGPKGILGNSFLATSAGSFDRVNGSDSRVSSEKGSLSRLGDDTWNFEAETTGGKPVLQMPDGIPAVSDNKAECAKDLERLVTNVTHNLWTLQFLDSWGKPGPSILQGRLNFVGNYRQCRGAKAPPVPVEGRNEFSGNYCLLGFAYKNASNVSPLAGILGPAAIQIGSCMPDSCSETEITLLLQLALVQLNVSSTLDVVLTECRTDDREYTAASIAAIVILSVILALMVCGTLFDLVFMQRPKWAAQRLDKVRLDDGSLPRTRYDPIPDEEEIVGADIEGHKAVPLNGESQFNGSTLSHNPGPVFLDEAKPLLGKGKVESKAGTSFCGLLGQVLLAFSVYTNGSKVLNTAQPPGSLTAINGIRCLSMSWVVLGHMYVFGFAEFANLAEEMPLLLKRWTYDAISNALVSVDTFFTLSGLLVAYLTTREMAKIGWKINWGLFYFHRFWRLTPPYMLSLLLYLGLLRFMGSGALWAKVQPVDKSVCEDNWWTNLLYINNLVRAEQQCFGHAWYLANDMQFYIVSPLMLIPFFFNVYAGITTCSIFLLAQWITTGVLSADNEWGATNVGLNVQVKSPYAKIQAVDDFEGEEATDVPDSLNYFTSYYITPYCRIGPYVVGVLAGHLLAVCNGRVRMNKITVVTGWVVSVATALAIVYGLRGDIGGESPSSVGAAALYNAVTRSVWGVCVCWVIVACSSGYGGPVNTLLSWSPFVTLGRLTYMAYLIHPIVMDVYFGNQETLYYLNDTNIVISYLGILSFTYLASFILMLGIESPMIGLEKVLLRRKRA